MNYQNGWIASQSIIWVCVFKDVEKSGLHAGLPLVSAHVVAQTHIPAGVPYGRKALLCGLSQTSKGKTPEWQLGILNPFLCVCLIVPTRYRLFC